MHRVAIVAACSLAVACGVRFPLLPDARTPADRAREVTPRCGQQPDPAAAQVLSPALVEGVEPAYYYVPSGGGVDRAIRMRGARLHLRPTLNMSAEALQRTLECHEARVTLGTPDEVQSDPYFLEGSWLDIHVDSTGDGLVAAVVTDALDDARLVLGRARTFATGHP
jgi:hypothetical protein